MRAAVYLLCWVAIVAVLVSSVSSSGINTWTQLNTIDAPSQRTGASASLNGDTVVVFGGNSVSKSGSTVFLSDAYGYNLDTDTWSSLSNGVVSARAGHSAITWNKGTIIFGGQKTNVTYTNEIWQYNTGTWTSITSTGSQPTARAYHATVVVGDNMFVFGGYNGTTYLNDIYQFALGTKVWTKLAPTSSPTARLGATLVANDAGNLVLFGGSDAKSANNELWVFDVTQKTWTQQNPATSPAARSKHSAGKVTGGFVVYGGQSGTTFLNDVWQYTYASSSWTRVTSSGSSPAARGGQATVVVAGGLVVFGGSLAHGQASDAWKFVSGPILSQSGVGYLDGRTKAAAAQKDTNSVMYIFGGVDSSDAALNDLITYNIATGQYATTNPTTRPAVRYNAALGIATAGALLFGGYDGSNVFGDVWLYQVSTNNWVQHNPTSTSKPVARYGHSIIADSTTSVLLFGGISESGDNLNDLWRYNIGPQTWTRLAAAATTVPLPRAYHTAAKVSSGLLVFGGLVDGDSNAAPENDLWLFDTTSTSWTQISEVGPSARYGAAIANVQGGVVVFGGADTSDNALSDAWRYDVTAEAWSQVSGISTSSRTFAVGGSTASAVVFFGGSANGAVVNSVDQLNIGGTVYVDKSGSDTTGDGSASKPFATILQAASFAPYGTIQVESGTYSGYGNINVMPNTVAQIVAHGAVIIDCANAGYGFAADASTTVLISSVAPSSFTITRCAPAVYVNGGSVTLSRVTLTNNAGATSLVSGQLQIVDSTISNNQAQSGGAVSAIAGYLILLRTTLSYNTAVQSGGAVSVASGVQFIATSLTVQHNRAATGAGIAVFGASVALQTSTFTNNTATVNGGALYVNGHAAVTLLGCSGTLNSADLGGFLYSDNSIVTLNDVTAQKSTATTGAGLYLYLSNHEITNSKVLENTATVNGGGAYFWLSTGSITSTAFTSNKAQSGAAVYADAKSEQTVASATFTSNTASLDGGAWYAKTSSATFSASTFTSNVAQRGAALFASQSAIATTGSSFTTNQASFGGAVAFYDIVAPTFATPTFTRNTATYGNFTATPVANMTVVSAPSGPQNASTVLPATVIHLVDALGQIVASDSTTMVTATIIVNPSTRAVTPTIKGTNPQTARNGVITFNDLQVVADEGTPVSIGFSSAGLQLQSSIGFVVSACTAGQQNENGACGQCAPGSYRSADAAASCVPCPVGSYSSVSGAASCTPCAAGTFAANTGMTQCFACPDGSWAPIGQDHCSECEMGTFSNAQVGFAQCTSCAPGYNSSVYGASQCQPCPSGTIAPDPKSLVCTPCVAGQYAPNAASSQCTACDPGSYSNFGATQCILCPAGQYSSLPGSPQCSICGFNRVSTAPGATSCQTCDICPAGWYQTSQPGQNTCPTCTRCGPGTFTAVSSSMSCTACPRGSFSSGYAAKSCLQCPVGTFAGSPGSVTCTPCPSKSATNIKGSVQCSACPANGYSVNGTSCQACPVGATCAGNTPLNSLSGYYGGPTTFVQCFAKTNCLGGNKCATGYSGPLCSVCTNGYGRLGTLCIDCLVGYVAGAWVLGVALAIFFIIHMFIMGRDVRLAQISGQQVHPRTSSIRILMNHLQVLGWLAILKVRWSGAIQLWFFIFSAVPVMNLSNFALDCTVGLSFYQQFFFFMLLPIITLVASFLIFLITYYIVTGRSSMKLSDLVPHYVTALIVIFRYIVPIIMLQIWQTVDCVNLDSGSYIAQDMRNACKSDTNTAAVGIGMVVFIIFIFAAPFYAFVKIMLNRKQLRYDNVTNMMAFLWLGYKEHRYFYEFFNICKNVVLIFFVLLLRRYTALQQMYSVVWLFIVVIFIFLWMRPYALPIQNVSEFFATLSQFGILITGVIYYDQGQIARPYYPIVDGFFIALNTLVILGLLVTIYWVHKMNKTFKPVLSLCSRDQKKKYEEDSDSEDDKKKSAYSLKNIRVMDEGLIPPLPPRSPRKGYGSQSDSYSYSSRSSRSSHTRSSRSRSPSIYSSDDQVRRRSRSRSNSRSASPASSRSRTDTEEAENNNKLQRRRSLSLDSRSSQEDNSSASSEFRRGQGSGRQRSASVSSSSSEESHSDSSEYGRQSRPQTGRNRSYSSSSASSDSSSDAELRRDDNPRKNRSRDSDEEPLNPTPSKGGNKNDQSYQDMNIGQLINNIEKLLGTEDD